MMDISEACVAIIKEYEGCELRAYRDTSGEWAIGYGHTRGVCEGMTIAQWKADELLHQDITNAKMSVIKYDPVYGWNQNQFDALVSFAFNVGNIDKLTAKGTRTIQEIADSIPKYIRSGGKIRNGLVARRAAERELFMRPCDVGD